MFSPVRTTLGRAAATTAAGLVLAVLTTGVGTASASAATPAKVPAKIAKFCKTWVALDKVGSTADTNTPDGIKAIVAAVQPIVASLGKTVPAAVSTQWQTMQSAFTAAAGGDTNAFNSDAFNSANAQLEVYVHDNCGFQQVEVAGVDYAFQGIPKKLEAGNTSFEFTNKSAMNEFHVFIVVKEKKGVHLSPKALLASGSQDEVMKQADVVAATAAPPGQVAGVVGKLTPGTYVVFCPATVGGTDAGAPHFMKGMVTGFTVK